MELDFEPIDRSGPRRREAQRILEAARSVEKRVAAGELSDDQAGVEIADLLERAKTLRAQQETDRGDAELRRQLVTMGESVGLRSSAATMPGQVGSGGKDHGWSEAVIAKALPGLGVKELIAPGTVFTPVPLLSEVIAEPQRAQFVVDLVPNRQAAEPVFSYLRQVQRQLRADVVAPGSEKPTSLMSVERVTGEVDVVAHVSEPIPRSYVEDSTALRTFITSELQYGLRVALDRLVLAGYTREDETEVDGLLSVSGHLEQAAQGDVFETLRRAALQIEALDMRPEAIVMNVGDFAEAELVQNTSGAYVMGEPGRSLPLDSARRTIWGLPVMVTTGLAAGKAIVANFRESTLLFVRENAVVSWSENVSDSFVRNLIVWRAELRAGLAITRPSAICEVNLGNGNDNDTNDNDG